jgi:2-polyprenyl-3-methyl-5-hydroxy-6-metoxy-1,4-benzoquinol methylase
MDFVEFEGKKYHKRAHPDCYELAFAIMGPPPRGRLLDVAAGAGYTSARLRSMGFDVTATDIHEGQFLADGVELVAADLNRRFPFDDGAFDAVVALEIIEHLENPNRFLRELRRVVKPGGRVALSTPNILCLRSRLRFLFRGEFHLFYDMQRRLEDPFHEQARGHITPMPAWLLQHFCADAGLALHGPRYTRESLGARGPLLSTNLVLELRAV